MSDPLIRACVIGSPIAHSRSPLIHGYWIKNHGIPGRYDKSEVTPSELGAFLDRIRSGEIAGCNITIPLKELAFKAVDRTDALTARLKSVNTVYMDGGQLVGTSTDGIGFMANLRQTITDWHADGQSVTMLGAGGAARALTVTLIEAGVARIVIANRTMSRAEAIAAEHDDRVSTCDWAALPDTLADTDLLVNSTSLGMERQPPLELSLETLRPNAVVADIVYAPLETDLLKQAALRGHRCVDGLGMLLHQAVPGFEKWFGVRPEVTAELRDIIAADIEDR